MKLDIIAGLTAGNYPVVLSASNGVGSNATITFTLTVNSIPTYSVSVSSAGTGATGSGNYEQGKTVTIYAGVAPAGMQFKNWTTTSEGVSFANALSATTTFVMPQNAVTVTAIFQKTQTQIDEDIQQTQTLKAWVENGTLYVSGLTAGKWWGVYNITGTLMYQGIAVGDNVETLRATSLQNRGIYIIQSGNGTIKVAF
jgi:hypothetical protein